MVAEEPSAPTGGHSDGDGLDDGTAMLASWRGPGQARRYRRGARWGGELGPARRTLTVRLAEDEIAELDEAAARAGLKRSGYVAAAALAAARADRPAPADRDAVLALVRATREALRVGNNLNQAVRALHATGHPPAVLERLARLTVEAVYRMEDEHAAVVAAFAGRKPRRRMRWSAVPERPANIEAGLAGDGPAIPAGKDTAIAAATPARRPADRPPAAGTVAGRVLQRRAAREDIQ